MKKIIYAMMLAGGLGASFSAMAAGESIPESGIVTGGSSGDCTLLSSNVRINLSAGVKGAYSCNLATNAIRVGTCHEAGTRTDAITCQGTPNEEDHNVTDWNNDQCTENGQVVNTGNPDFRGFFATSSGGTVAPRFLGGVCDDTNLAAHGFFD